MALSRARAFAGPLVLACAVTSGSAGLAGAWPDRLEGHGGPVRGLALSVAGDAALSGSFDYTVIHWRLDGERAEIARRLVGHDAAVNDVAFVPGADRAVSASDDGTVAVWDLVEGDLVARFGEGGARFLDVEVSPDGRLAAAAGWDRTGRLWDIAAETEVAALRGHSGPVNAVAFSADGERVFTASEDGDVRMWDTADGGMLRLVYRHGWGVNALAVAPRGEDGGEVLVFGAVDGAVLVVDPETGEALHELALHGGPVLTVAADALNGLAVVGAADGGMHIYALDDWSRLHEYANPYGPIWASAITPDGAVVYHAGLDDFAIGLRIDPRRPFDPAEGEFPRRFQVREDMDTGERQFARKCSVCHTLTPDDANRAGPTLYGVFGREAGSLPGYPYSEALRESDIVWNEDTIAELFDRGPDVVTPGTKMPIQRLRDEAERAALVAFLKRATGEETEKK